MRLKIYKTYLWILNLALAALIPIAGILFPLIFPWAKNRKIFELKNLSDPGSKEHKYADICFEVSSEGELEQVMPVLEYFLLQKKTVELVYSSESVEKKVQNLFNKYPKNIFIFRLPLVTYPTLNLNWIKADTLVLCRYDFFPHLILQGLSKKRFVLLSASLKGKENPKKIPYEFFDLIVCASDKEKKAFEKLLGSAVPLMTMDLRVLRIISRLENAPKTLDKISSYLEKINQHPLSSRIVIGSAYAEEMKIFENEALVEDLLKGKIHICIAPHKLAPNSVADISKLIPKHLNWVSIKENSSLISTPPVAVMLVPGILCELYSHFGHAFVGGGHLKSVHSLLEPYLTGAKIYCGPKTHRSTEFDFILGNSKESIAVVTNPKDFYDYLNNGKEVKGPPDLKEFNVGFEKLISFLRD